MTTPTIEVPGSDEIIAAVEAIRDAGWPWASLLAALPGRMRLATLKGDESYRLVHGIAIGLQIAAMRAEDDREDLRAADINDRD